MYIYSMHPLGDQRRHKQALEVGLQSASRLWAGSSFQDTQPMPKCFDLQRKLFLRKISLFDSRLTFFRPSKKEGFGNSSTFRRPVFKVPDSLMTLSVNEKRKYAHVSATS